MPQSRGRPAAVLPQEDFLAKPDKTQARGEIILTEAGPNETSTRSLARGGLAAVFPIHAFPYLSAAHCMVVSKPSSKRILGFHPSCSSAFSMENRNLDPRFFTM